MTAYSIHLLHAGLTQAHALPCLFSYTCTRAYTALRALTIRAGTAVTASATFALGIGVFVIGMGTVTVHAAEVSMSDSHLAIMPVDAADHVFVPDASAYWPQVPTPARRGIEQIATVQTMAVHAPQPMDIQVEVPRLAAQCALLRREDNTDDVPEAADGWDRLLAEKCDDQDQGWRVASQRPEPVYVFGLQTAPQPVFTPMGTLSYKPARRQPILRLLTSRGGTQYTERNIVRRQADGPSVAFGSVLTRSPSWTDGARIGGVQLSDWGESRTLKPGQMGYSTMIGVLDYTDVAATSGGYQYGATVGSSSMRYGVSSGLTLESHVESGPSLTAMGLGSTYSLGGLGEVQAGASQSEFGTETALRQRLGYTVNLADAVDVGYVTEQIGAGYNDLADYRTGAATQDQVRNIFSARVPLGHYGTLSGTYTGLRSSGAYVERRYGFNHQVDLSRTVALGVGADRDAVSGDYAMHMTLAMPVDAFLGRLGLFR